MKKVVSVVAKPLRALGGILLKLLGRLRGLGRLRLGRLRSLGTPLVKLSQLRGRALVFALVPIVIVLILLFNALKPEPDRAKEVGDTLDRFAAATRDKDYQTLCDELYASELVERIRAAGLPCEVALRTGLEDRQNPQLKVLEVDVTDDQARARIRTTAVGEPASVDVVRLIDEDGSWRIESLSEPGSTAQFP
jgi:hypothetical protein